MSNNSQWVKPYAAHGHATESGPTKSNQIFVIICIILFLGMIACGVLGFILPVVS